VQSDGTLTLQQCAGVAAEGQSSDSTADWSMVWTKNVGFFSDFFTLLAEDDVDRNIGASEFQRNALVIGDAVSIVQCQFCLLTLSNLLILQQNFHS
jgi:hypothetical protein